MKKVISLILIAVMLLGALPALASAQTQGSASFAGYTVSLGESIAVEFYTNTLNAADFDRVVFYKDGVEMTTITSCPAAEAKGRVYFKFNQLGPHEMDATIKAELYLKGNTVPVDTREVSVLNYCTAILAQGNEKLNKLIVDMLNYGAAAEAYMNDESKGICTYVDGLSNEVKALGTTGEATVNELTSTVYQEVEGATVEITKAALVLNSGIVPRFTFSANDVTGLTAMVSCAGKTWEISSFEETETANTYTFDFNGMNPSRVRSGILVAFKNANGDLVSNIRIFTAEHYAAIAPNDSVKALTSAMMHYGDAAKAYVLRDFSSGILTEEEKTVLSALTAQPYAAAKKENQEIAIWAYSEAGIDVSTSFDKSVLDLMQKIFQGDSTEGRSPISADSSSYEAKYGDMLVEGYYGGTEVKTADKVFTAADFQVGDVFCAVWNTTGYYAGIYLGDGKFLMSNNVSGDWTTAIDKTTVFSKTLADDMGIYFVLRPEQLAHYVAPFAPDTPPEMEDGVITRSEMEAALAEVAWDYYVKGVKVQYDSMDLNTRNDGANEPLSKYSGGFWRTTTISTLEDADSDTYLFTVCSDYAWNVYFETLGYPILGNRLNCHTSQFWRGTEAPDDMVVLRWHNQGKGTYLSNYDDDYGMTFDDWYELADVKTFLQNWKENLRPGDIITARTGNSAHTVLYVGNGMILHSNGEGKYNMVKGTDKPEAEGSISLSYVEDYYFKAGRIFNLDAMQDASSQAWICVVRPLDILTKDDEDNDPSNDVLDPDYVLNTGKLNAQLSIDPRPLQTSGYTIKDTTFTRMAYPGMDIDRTVDITPYGTVAKDGTLTYTIEISNRSADPKYVEYRTGVQGEAYVGEAYEGLIIEEHVPENTVLVSAPGAYVEDGTLRWQVDIPRGESVVLTYTVKVTGAIGEKIVNGGGLVANIPSNTLTNIIGGAKLSDEALENMDAFAQASKSKWNSNDGYKITAAMTAGTVFAERIYNETTGLDLQLPEIQELMDILFNYEMINVQSCLYLSHDSDGVTRYMYTLNEDAADPDNQVYCDMVIDGYFGGVWAFSNDYAGEPRIYEFRTDYLEPGDIIIHTNLTPSATDGKTEETRKVEEWNVVVYLGNGTFASLSSDGRLKKIQDDSAIMPGFSYDLFVALRPSQAYANINTDVAAFAGPAKDLTDEDIATVYKGNISDVLLNDDNAAALAALQASAFTQHSGKFIGEVYSKIGLDVVTDGTMNSSFSTVVKALFADNANDTTSANFMEYGHEYHLLEEPLSGTEKLYDMLMFYGGPAFATSKHITSLNDLHPGDAVMLGRGVKPTVNYGSMDVVAVYQGNGKFLVSIRDLAGTYYGTVDYKEWTATSFASDAEFTAWLAAPIVEESSDCFEGYVVLRPSRVFEDVNTMAYAGDNSIVPDGSEISSERSIKDSLLNNAEKLQMANLTVADWVAAKKPVNLLKVPSWIYSQLNINDISNYFDQTMFYLRNGLFYKSGSWYHLSDIGRANHVEKYHRMLVSGCYGGFNFETSRTLKENDFQIGDLFCAWTVDEHGDNIYWVGLYQGNYQFLLIRSGGNNNIKVAEEAYLTELNARISSGDYAFYFVLRPEQLVPHDITTGALTDREKKVLSSLTAEAYAATGKGNTEIVKWAYGEAGIDVSANFDQTVFPLMGKIFSGGKGARCLIQPDNSSYNATYSGMLVEGYYGGAAITEITSKTFTKDDFQVGDVFCAVYYPDPENNPEGKAYYAGIYLGGGKFLMSCSEGGWSTQIDTTTVFDPDIASKHDIYFVLRPEQLAPRDFTSGVMTNMEKAVISALTVEQYQAAIAADDAVKDSGIAIWAYAQAGIDVSANFDKSVWNLMYAIFGGDTSGRYPYLPNSASYTAKYSRMLVDGYYAGAHVTWDKGFENADFQVGDVFFAVYYPDLAATGTRKYYAGICLGGDNFLISNNAEGTYSATAAIKTFDEIVNANMGIYFVLRPEQLAQEAPTGLIAETRAKLSALTEANLTAAGKTNDTGALNWICEQYGFAKWNKSVYGISELIFDKTNGVLLTETSQWMTMLVDGYYGGSIFNHPNQFTAEDFEVGDIFCARNGSQKDYVALYLGDGEFLTYDEADSPYESIDTATVFSDNLDDIFDYYYVLRPAQYLNTPAS